MSDATTMARFVARRVEERALRVQADRSDRWHQELLDRMALDLDDVRPALLRRGPARC